MLEACKVVHPFSKGGQLQLPGSRHLALLLIQFVLNRSTENQLKACTLDMNFCLKT